VITCTTEKRTNWIKSIRPRTRHKGTKWSGGIVGLGTKARQLIRFMLQLLYFGEFDSISIECALLDVIQSNCNLICTCRNTIFSFVPEFHCRGTNKSISTTVTNAASRVNKLCFRCFEMVSAKRQEKVVTRFPLHSTGPGLYFLCGGRIISMRVLTGFGRPDQSLAVAREKLSDS
jgi:hypothetical protein